MAGRPWISSREAMADDTSASPPPNMSEADIELRTDGALLVEEAALAGRRADRRVAEVLLVEEIARTLRTWSELLGRRGVAAILNAAMSAGLDARVLGLVGGERRLTDLNRRLDQLDRTRASLGHAETLKRGFAIVRDESGQPVVRRAKVKPGQRLAAEFADGEVRVRAEEAPKRTAPARKRSGARKTTAPEPIAEPEAAAPAAEPAEVVETPAAPVKKTRSRRAARPAKTAEPAPGASEEPAPEEAPVSAPKVTTRTRGARAVPPSS